MSPRAALRLERFGFEVYDYAAGKVDWLAAGLPAVQAHPLPSACHSRRDATTSAGRLGFAANSSTSLAIGSLRPVGRVWK